MEIEKYFILYETCIPVCGVKNAIIMDIQRQNFYYIPKSLYRLTSKLKKYKIKDLLIKFEKYREELVEYIEYLQENDLGFFTLNPANFPKLNTKLEEEYYIYDSILEMSNFNLSHFENIIANYRLSGCKHLEIRINQSIEWSNFILFLNAIKYTKIRDISIFIDNKLINVDLINSLLNDYIVISKIYIFGTYSDKYNVINSERIEIIKRKLDNSDCGKKILNNFTVTVPFYILSKNKNNCLHKKISIDKFGNVRNCLSLPFEYGRIPNVDFVKLSLQADFIKVGDIKKDDISVCKVCEFRYMCSDCRAYTENIFDKPKYCTYNPYEKR